MDGKLKLRLTEMQARELYTLLYDHGHWHESLFPVRNAIIDMLEITSDDISHDREEKDHGVRKLIALFTQQGSEGLAKALDLGSPEDINQAKQWGDLEAIWHKVNMHQKDQVALQSEPKEERRLVILTELEVSEIYDDIEQVLFDIEVGLSRDVTLSINTVGYRIDVKRPYSTDFEEVFSLLEESEDRLIDWIKRSFKPYGENYARDV